MVIYILDTEPSAIKIVESFVQKNSNLGSKNAYFSRMRNQAENKLESLKAEYRELEESITTLEESNAALENRKKQLEQDKEKLEADIRSLFSENDTLASKIEIVTSQNDELIGANEQLKKDNKDLKNLVDAIRLRLARDTKTLLQYEDSQLRKALIILFRWTLG